MEERGDRLCTSIFTVGEVLTGLYQKEGLKIASQIRQAYLSPQIELIPFTSETADRYARIRAGHRVTPADAIHLASAAVAGIDLFLTNDHRLQRLAIGAFFSSASSQIVSVVPGRTLSGGTKAGFSKGLDRSVAAICAA